MCFVRTSVTDAFQMKLMRTLCQCMLPGHMTLFMNVLRWILLTNVFYVMNIMHANKGFRCNVWPEFKLYCTKPCQISYEYITNLRVGLHNTSSREHSLIITIVSLYTLYTCAPNFMTDKMLCLRNKFKVEGHIT